AYDRLLQAMDRANAPAAQRAPVAKRLTVLSLAAGDRAGAQRHAQQFIAAGGSGLAVPAVPSPASVSFIEIPGPLFSFARMAALSPELTPAEVLPALARNIVTNGYQAVSASEALEQTEYLKLMVRYLSQARELEKLAGTGKVLKI